MMRLMTSSVISMESSKESTVGMPFAEAPEVSSTRVALRSLEISVITSMMSLVKRVIWVFWRAADWRCTDWMY